MKINIARLFLHGKKVEKIEGKATVPLLNEPFQGIVVDSEVEYCLDITSIENGIYRLTGEVSAFFLGECSRCLKKIRHNLKVNLDVYFLPKEILNQELINPRITAHLTEEVLEVSYYYTHPYLDLSIAFKDQFYLEMPLRLTCPLVCQEIFNEQPDEVAEDKTATTKMADLFKLAMEKQQKITNNKKFGGN